MLFRVFDTETTGLPEKGKPNDHKVIELAYTDVLMIGSGCSIVNSVETFVQTDRAVDIAARATHHITDDEIQSGVSQDDAIALFLKGDPDYFVAHNIEFDRLFMPIRDDMAICTFKAATHAWDTIKHSNQFLRYYLNLDIDPVRAQPPHRALPDTYVTAHILIELLKKFSPDELLGFTMQPRKITKFPIGKFFGLPLSDPSVDIGYLNWVIRTEDMDPDLKHACRLEIERRYKR